MDRKDYMYMEGEKVSGWTKFKVAAFFVSAFVTLVSVFALIFCSAKLAYECWSGSATPCFTLLIIIAAVFVGSAATFLATFASLEKGCAKGMGKELP